MPEDALYMGLMSGTSLDGIDGVVVDLHAPKWRIAAEASVPMPAPLRAELTRLCVAGADEIGRAGRVEVALTEQYAALCHTLLARLPAPERQRVRCLGCLGQTIRHAPRATPHGYTVQLLDGARLTARTGLATACDFRRADTARGGEGAPLAPPFHAALLRAAGVAHHAAIVNIGGVANVSVVPPAAAVRGWDTGPGNRLLDDWCARHIAQPYDADGAFARSGRCRDDLLAIMLADPYLAEAPPKSTGREYFHSQWLDACLARVPIQPEGRWRQDIAATLTEFTARTLTAAIYEHAAQTQVLYLAGGGAQNGFLRERIRANTACAVHTSTALGVPPHLVEATLAAWYAAQRWHGAPVDLRQVTGSADAHAVLGALYVPSAIPARRKVRRA